MLLGRDDRVSDAERDSPHEGTVACPAVGWGGHARSEVAAGGVIDGLSIATSCGTIELSDAECRAHHVHKELLGVFLALMSRREELRHKRVAIFVDATASVAYLAKWGGPSAVMTRIVRRVWALCAAWDIRVVQVSHISGTRMITVGVDSLSRPYKFARGGEMDRDDWRMRDEAFGWLQGMARAWLGRSMEVDRMASRANTRLPRFNSVSSVDPAAEGFSAFAEDWSVGGLSYVFPPFALIPRVLQHVRECRALAVVVVPEWPSQAWWREMVSMMEYRWYFPARAVFERVVDGEWRPVATGGRLLDRATGGEWQTVRQTSFTPIAVVLNGNLKWG